MIARPPREPPPHERRVLLLALASGLPGAIVTVLLLVAGDYSAKTVWTVGGLVTGAWLVGAIALRERVVRPLQTLSNMLAALREGDFSLRARLSRSDDALGLALLEINMLGETLRSQRLGALEATSLLRAVMSEIDVAIFAFDDTGALRLANRAGERLLAQRFERIAGRPASSLGVAELLGGDSPRVYDHAFPERAGRWEVRRTTFRQEGRPHVLLVVTDVTRTLREEELLAWQRLVRVLSHEINNSLAPIKSIAGSLRAMSDQAPGAPGAREDLHRGLDIIEGRADSLARFMSSYARLARLPSPVRRRFDLGAMVRRAAGLESRLAVGVEGGPAIEIVGDPDQLEQALINLVRNAVDAVGPDGGRVCVGWRIDDRSVEIQVEDDGHGISGTSNLFVPFFTTKPEGSGIGLVLCRQIAEGHGGSVTIENRSHGRGAVARLRLPR
ncbi:MAG: PAS domain S-box protein [Gemmatimonadaceae bacterium]|nr:PAS domain S-box protein [Gemmatimonadaceae bacterium]